MRAALEWIEAAVLVFVIGLIIMLGAATLIHTFSAPPEPRADLTSPPSTLTCPDSAGHCLGR